VTRAACCAQSACGGGPVAERESRLPRLTAPKQACRGARQSTASFWWALPSWARCAGARHAVFRGTAGAARLHLDSFLSLSETPAPYSLPRTPSRLTGRLAGHLSWLRALPHAHASGFSRAEGTLSWPCARMLTTLTLLLCSPVLPAPTKPHQAQAPLFAVRHRHRHGAWRPTEGACRASKLTMRSRVQGATPPPFRAPPPASAWPPPPPSSLFGGLPSGSSATHLLLSASQSTPQQGLRDAACGALYAQWVLSGGGSLGGAEFHRPGAQALADNPRLFKPVPHRATSATWGMVKSASMPELGELTMDDLPLLPPPQTLPRLHSNLKPQEEPAQSGEGYSHAQPLG